MCPYPPAPGPSSNHNLMFLSLLLVHWILEDIASFFKKTGKKPNQEEQKEQCCYGFCSQLWEAGHSQPASVDGWVVWCIRVDILPRSPPLTVSAYRPCPWTHKGHMTRSGQSQHTITLDKINEQGVGLSLEQSQFRMVNTQPKEVFIWSPWSGERGRK